ncbi:uncharacterized protein LOC131071597 [Cryptomeria japonica]|uniref:uncharacterized protein LOC131071597 n=1 Tax=Cryptomeria japonica TaxID=3369 RepID=UPI0025AD6A95|nr:uncharacterized protein LOC131071597 [Cryptomeria japonica]
MESPHLPSGDNDDNSALKKKRLFDHKLRNACWNKADTVPGRHPERWRKDIAGNTVCRKFLSCQGCLCYEYDHVRPFSKGGETDVKNCQILQSRVNRFKGNKEDLGKDDLEQFSCHLKFTGTRLFPGIILICE